MAPYLPLMESGGVDHAPPMRYEAFPLSFIQTESSKDKRIPHTRLESFFELLNLRLPL